MSDDYDDDDFEFSQQVLANMDAFEASLRSPSVELEGLRAPIASTSSRAMDAVPDIESACFTSDGQQDQEHQRAASTSASSKPRSLFERFRRRNALAVTDLSSPGYCEVRHRYNLLGKRHLAPSERPATILREDGKSIEVNKKIQKAADQVMDAGKAVHKRLELEYQPEQRIVVTETKADTVVLRLRNMLVSLQLLKETGLAREVPIFGFLDGFYVTGIIDEVQRRPIPKKDASNKKTKSTSEPPQTNHLGNYFQISPKKAKPSEPTHELVLVDHKTRSGPRMPHSSWTTTNRMQLMIYKKLWDAFSQSQVDWSSFLAHYNVAPEDTISDSFKKELQEDDLPQFASLNTVQNFCGALKQAFAESGSLSSVMEIVYRRRKSPTSSRESSPQRSASPARATTVGEEKDMQRAIAASLQGDGAKSEEAESQDVTMHAPHRKDGTSSPTSEPDDNIIGVERFDYSAREIDAWVKNVGAYWRSERDPQGVSAAEVSYKCRFCEYNGDCEWLEMKAGEAAARARQRREEREST